MYIDSVCHSKSSRGNQSGEDVELISWKLDSVRVRVRVRVSIRICVCDGNACCRRLRDMVRA